MVNCMRNVSLLAEEQEHFTLQIQDWRSWREHYSHLVVTIWKVYRVQFLTWVMSVMEGLYSTMQLTENIKQYTANFAYLNW